MLRLSAGGLNDESKRYKPLLAADLQKAKKEQLKPTDPAQWRRSEYSYSSPEGAKFYHDVGEWFEVVSNIVVVADDRVEGKRLHGAAAVRRAFAEAGLDPRNPNHWLQLVQIFADAHYLRRPTDKRKTRSKLDEIKAHAESIRKKKRGISKTHLIDEMKRSSKKYPSESTLEKLLHKAGVRWYTQPAKKRFSKKSK